MRKLVLLMALVLAGFSAVASSSELRRPLMSRMEMVAPEVALAVNHGDVVVSFPKRLNCPLILNMPKDVFLNVFLRYVDLPTALKLRRCSKEIYAELLENRYTKEYFSRQLQKVYDDYTYYTGFFQELTIWEAMPRVKALRWFKEKNPSIRMDYMLDLLADHELCPRVLFDAGYWRMKRKYADPNVSSTFKDKLILAIHGGDDLGTVIHFLAKTGINIGLVLANGYFWVHRQVLLPESCERIYGFPRGSFVPSVDAQDILYNWALPYRMYTFLIPYMVMQVKDLYRLHTTPKGLHVPSKGKVLNIKSRWPIWRRDDLPESWQKNEFGIMAFAVSYCMFLHPLLITWAVPMKGPVQESLMTVANYSQIVTANAANSSWMKGCCMQVSHYVQPGCYVPWALEGAKQVTTYGVREVADQAFARLVSITPMFLMGLMWTFYFMVARGMI